MAKKVNEAIDDMSKKMDDISHKVDKSIETTKDAIHDAQHRAEQTIQTTKDEMHSVQRNVEDKWRLARQDVDSKVKQVAQIFPETQGRNECLLRAYGKGLAYFSIGFTGTYLIETVARFPRGRIKLIAPLIVGGFLGHRMCSSEVDKCRKNCLKTCKN